MGDRIATCRVLWGDLRERDHLEDLGVNGRIVLKWELQEVRWGHGLI
jgi:hypothetical protein